MLVEVVSSHLSDILEHDLILGLSQVLSVILLKQVNRAALVLGILLCVHLTHSCCEATDEFLAGDVVLPPIPEASKDVVRVLVEVMVFLGFFFHRSRCAELVSLQAVL